MDLYGQCGPRLALASQTIASGAIKGLQAANLPTGTYTYRLQAWGVCGDYKDDIDRVRL